MRALLADGWGGVEEVEADDRFVGGFAGVYLLRGGVVGHVGAVADGDVVDVEEVFLAALLVTDLVAGV